MPKGFIVENRERCPHHRVVAGCKWFACEHKKFWQKQEVIVCEGPQSDMCPLPNVIVLED
jgi:hypothetical protein